MALIFRNPTVGFYFIFPFILSLGLAFFWCSLFPVLHVKGDFVQHYILIGCFNTSLFTYGLYSYSWESDFIPYYLIDKRKLRQLTRQKLIFNLMTNLFVLLFMSILLLFIEHPQTFVWEYLFLEALISMFFNNLLVLLGASFSFTKISLFKKGINWVRQPPVHILIGLVLVSINLALLLSYSLLNGIYKYGIVFIVLFLSIILYAKSNRIIFKNLSRGIIQK